MSDLPLVFVSWLYVWLHRYENVIAAAVVFSVFFFFAFLLTYIDLLVSAITCDKCTFLYVNAHDDGIAISWKHIDTIFASLYDYWFIVPKRSCFLLPLHFCFSLSRPLIANGLSMGLYFASDAQ